MSFITRVRRVQENAIREPSAFAELNTDRGKHKQTRGYPPSHQDAAPFFPIPRLPETVLTIALHPVLIPGGPRCPSHRSQGLEARLSLF